MRINLKKASLKQLQQLMQEQGPQIYPEIVRVLAGDPRSGAQRLLRHLQADLGAEQRRREKMGQMWNYERQVWAMGYRLVAGVDEAGRGPLAGPVVAAAVAFTSEVELPGLGEVRRLSEKRRQELYEAIQAQAAGIGVGMVQPEGIDESSVLLATYQAMVQAVANLPVRHDYLLIDSLHLPEVGSGQFPIVGGEGLSASISAAAHVAKMIRDQYMIEADREYPQYGFARHKGYGTAEHRAALEQHGPCPLHRRVGGPVRPVALPNAHGR